MVMQAHEQRPKVIGKSPVAAAKVTTPNMFMPTLPMFCDKIYLMFAPKLCAICGKEHVSDWPHDRDSLIYQYTFQQKHKRPPTWSDAMAHCSRRARAYWRRRIRDAFDSAGIDPPADLAIDLDPKIDD